MSNWIVSLILGILAVVAGGFALVYPFGASLAVELFIAWSFIILGIVTIIAAFFGNQTNGRWWSVLLGVLMIITGVVLLRNPLAGILALSFVFAILTIVSGITKIVAGFRVNKTSLKWLTIISGVASLILAVLIFTYPVLSLGILFALELIFDGMALIFLSFARTSGGLESY